MKKWSYLFNGLCLGYLLGQLIGWTVLDSKVDNGSAIDKPEENWEDFTFDELYERARTLDIAGRSKMNKQQLINVLRSY